MEGDKRDILGRRQTVESAQEEIPAVLVDLNIDDGLFTTMEFSQSLPETGEKC